MSAIVEFWEDNGSPVGSPKRGSVRQLAAQCDWKSVDSSQVGRYYAPVAAGACSFPKFQFAVFSGSWNSISGGLFAHVANESGAALSSFIKLWGTVSSQYLLGAAAPSQARDNNAATDMTGVVLSPGSEVAGCLSVKFSLVGPQDLASMQDSLDNTGAVAYSQYLVTQVQLSKENAVNGDSDGIILALIYDEN